MNRSLACMGCVLFCGAMTLRASGNDIQRTIAAIQEAACADPGLGDKSRGRPLPLASHWNTRAWDLAYQTQLIEQGHHILPWVRHPARPNDLTEVDRAQIRRWAEWKLPITVRDGNYGIEMLKEPYSKLAPDQNPLTVTPDGRIDRRPCPFGPVEPWRQVGRSYMDNDAMRLLQKLYPDPPRVFFLSNNEMRVLRWHELGLSKRFLDRYGAGRSDDFKRQMVVQGWIERFGALLNAMREGLENESWRKNARFIAYNAFGPCHYARWEGWKQYALPTPERIDSDPLIWDGGSPSYYDNQWEKEKADYRVWSTQIEAMNWIFMLKEAMQLRPNFWFEISVWDGASGSEGDKGKAKKDIPKPEQYRARGQSWSPERYQGRIQFGMWLTRPRAVREFRGHGQPREPFQPYWEAVMEAVDRIHRIETLKRFWQFGELVANREHRHPWQADTLEEYQNEDRWFLLETSLDPPRPWSNETEIPVFSLALCVGETGGREWLVYAHSPLGERKAVRVSIPAYKAIEIDVPIAGAFYRVAEKTGEAERINLNQP